MSRFPADRLLRDGYRAFVEIPVLYGDLDTNNHINNVIMGRYFEHARVATNRVLRSVEPGLFFLVARVSIDYLSEGRFGHPLTVGTRFARAGRTSITMEQAAWQDEEDRVVALCETVIVRLVDGAPAELSAAMRDMLEASAAPATASPATPSATPSATPPAAP